MIPHIYHYSTRIPRLSREGAICELQFYTVLVKLVHHSKFKTQAHREVHRTYLQLGGHKGLAGHCCYTCMVGSYLQISGGSQNTPVHTYTKHRKAKKHSSNASFITPYFSYLRHNSWETGKVT